jgi:oligoendopeptidase F
VKGILPQIREYQGKIGETSENFLAVLRLSDEIAEAAETLGIYAEMRRDENTNNNHYQGLASRAESLFTVVQSALAFINPEILTIPEERLEQYFDANGDLEMYRFAIRDLLRSKEHTLSPPEEELLAQTGEIQAAPGQIFNILKNADLAFPVVADEDGKDVEAGYSGYDRLRNSEDRNVRREAFLAHHKTFRAMENTMSATLGSSIKGDVFTARVRRFPSALEAALFPDNVPAEVYDNLIDTVRSSLQSAHRYVKVRSEILDIPEMHLYDMSNPLINGINWKITYDDSVKMVSEAMAPLGDEYGKLLSDGFHSRWIDVYPRKGKHTGGYCGKPYRSHPFVLVNYQDQLDDASTVAHEMGHALHYCYAHANQPFVYGDNPIFTAEVASTVGESIFIHYLLDREKDPKRRMLVLASYLDLLMGTLFRQTMYAEFEKVTHEMVEKDEALTPEVMNKLWHDLLQDYYGPETVIDDDAEVGWARIPHFYSAFYVYKYATGISAATALAKNIMSGEKDDVAKYLDFLKLGASDYPVNLLKKAGVDMSTPKPIQETIALFDKLVNEVEETAANAVAR